MNEQQEKATKLFVQRAPKRIELGGKLTDTQFRRSLMDDYMEQFGASNAKAATLYNNAKKHCEANEPKLVINLGRKASTVAPTAKTPRQSTASNSSKSTSKRGSAERADSRQLWSALSLTEAQVGEDTELVVDEVWSYYDKQDALKKAGKKKNFMVVKGCPECDTLAHQLKDIREKC